MSAREKLKSCAKRETNFATLTRAESQWVINQLNKLDDLKSLHDIRMEVARRILSQPLPDHDYINYPG